MRPAESVEVYLCREGTGREEMAEAAGEWDAYVMSADIWSELEDDY